MTEKREVRKIFIGSPGDLNKEREIFRDVVVEVNRIKAHVMGIELEAVGWEDTLPGKGRPQELINDDIKKCDFAILLLWKRWGIDRGKYSSGFEEEYELVISLHEINNGKPEIIMYFKSIPDDMLEDPGEQLRKVLDFRDIIEKENKFLFNSYETAEKWGKTFREHLCLWLDGVKPELPVLPDMTEKLQQIEKLEKKLEKSRSTEMKNAIDWAKEAQDHADNGRLTKAEEYFARAISAHSLPYIINKYGLFLKRIGSLEKAEEKFKQVLEIGKSISDKKLLAVGYGNLGVIYKTRGDLDEAEKMYKKSLKINKELGRKQGMANQYGNLGLIYKTKGDLKKCKEMLKLALELFKEIGAKIEIEKTEKFIAKLNPPKKKRKK